MNTARKPDIMHDAERMVAEIDLNETAVYIVREGSVEKLESPTTSYGCQTITWHQGDITNAKVEHSYQFKKTK